MFPYSIILNKYVLGGLVLVSLLGGVYYTGYVHGERTYVELKSQYEAQAKVQEEQQQKIMADNAATVKRINDEAKQQVDSMSVALGDLSMRLQSNHRAISLCPATTSTSNAVNPTNGSAATASPQPTQAATPTVAIDSAILGDTLDTAISAVTAELQWRDYARNTGQAK